MTQMEKMKRWIIFLTLYSLTVSAVYFLRPGNEADYLLAVNVVNYFSALILAYLGYETIMYFGLKNMQGRIALLIAMSGISFVIADIVWYHLGNPVVSAADLIWFAGYIFLYHGIFYSIKLISVPYPQKRIINLTHLAMLLAVVSYFSFFRISWDKGIGILENIATAGYVFADLILIIFGIALISNILRGTFSLSWIALGIGIFLRTAGDLFYSVNYAAYNMGDLVGLAYVLSYTFYCVSFVLLRHHAEKALGKGLAAAKKQAATG
jgi:hypothetical protein